VTLVVAIIAVLLSLASLAWQAWAFVLSGSRVKVVLGFGSMGPGGTLVWDISTRGKDTGLGSGYVPVLVVQATNTGRADISIMEWGVRLNGEGTMTNHNDINVAVPCRLAHESQQNWYLGDDGVQHAVDITVRPGPVKAQGFVRLGNGKTRYTAALLLERSST
jgi:hypothetical protein